MFLKPNVQRCCYVVLALLTQLSEGAREQPTDQVAFQDTASEYPTELTYTQYHTWFHAHPNTENLTRIGTTSYAISHFLHSSIDGGAIYPDRNDSVSAGETIGRFVGVTGDEVLEIKAPFTAVFHAPNLDLDLDGMVTWPYGDQGFLALLRGAIPQEGEHGVIFMNSTEYSKFVEKL